MEVISEAGYPDISYLLPISHLIYLICDGIRHEAYHAELANVVVPSTSHLKIPTGASAVLSIPLTHHPFDKDLRSDRTRSSAVR